MMKEIKQKLTLDQPAIYHLVFARIERISIIHKDLAANRGHFYWPKSLEQYFSKQIIISSA